MDTKSRGEAYLNRIYWIGGPPDSGKTTVATILAERYGLQHYSFDRREMAHFALADPLRHPALYAAHPDRMTTEERWLGSTPEEMARMTIECWSERVAMAVDDLLELPHDREIIAEGPGFFPSAIEPYLIDPRRAIFLIPRDEFKRASALQRGKPGNRHETTDPERATEQLIARDLLMGATIRAQASNAGLRVIDVGDDTPLDVVLELVVDWFGFSLPR